MVVSQKKKEKQMKEKRGDRGKRQKEMKKGKDNKRKKWYYRDSMVIKLFVHESKLYFFTKKTPR